MHRTPAQIAEKLDGSRDGVERYWLWQMLGEAVAGVCHPSGEVSTIIAGAVSSVTADVVAIDEYTLDRAHRSVELDLEFLSPPLPTGV